MSVASNERDTKSEFEQIPLGISSCLLGEKVRFDSGHKHNAYITATLGEYFSFNGFCPEVTIGLGTPREPIRLVEEGDRVRCVGTKNAEMDVTEPLEKCGREQAAWIGSIYGYIFKKDSPSCGMERVKVYNKTTPKRDGRGIFAATVMDMFPDLPVEEEGRLGDARLRENFIKRVFVYKRWRDLLDDGVTRQGIVDFHARHKLIYTSHSQAKARELGRLVAVLSDYDIHDFCQTYIGQVTELMRKPASRKNHTNVLQHIQGYLKRDLDAGDRQELEQMIEHYRLGVLPLIVPITILRHHFRKYPDAYIDRSWYMHPHPVELMLHNQL